MFLVEYDKVYITRNEVERSVIVNHLTDNAIEDYKPLNFDFLEENILVVENEEEPNYGKYILIE